MAREDTQFKPGHKKLPGAGRAKGTPNKPISIKAAMKQYCDERGYLVPAALDYAMEHDNPMLRLRAAQFMLEYGIGLPAKMAPDTGRGDLIFHTKFPLGTDPDALERWFEEEAIRRGLIKGGQPRLQAQAPTKDRGKIFNEALLRAVGHKDAPKRPVPQEVLDAMTDEDGNPLEVVEHELPKIYEPDQQLREDE